MSTEGINGNFVNYKRKEKPSKNLRKSHCRYSNYTSTLHCQKCITPRSKCADTINCVTVLLFQTQLHLPIANALVLNLVFVLTAHCHFHSGLKSKTFSSPLLPDPWLLLEPRHIVNLSCPLIKKEK